MFCLRVGTSQHTILRTTIWAVNDPMLPNSGKKLLTQQSTSIGNRFLPVKDGDRPKWQPTTSVLVATFLVQNRMVWIELAASRMIEDTTIYKKMRNHWWHIWSSIDALIAMVWQRMDSIIHMYLEKMRYPEILKNYLNQFNDSFFDLYRTNLI